jgi:hypothetical protein
MPFEDFFQSSTVQETTFFDEGPKIRPVSIQGINTSSISTVLIDGYRQGVELTQLKHFDAGTVKIHAGEPGHKLRRNRFGMDKNFRPDPTFEELDYFNAEFFLRAQELAEPLLLNIITFPIITGDNDQIENYYLDGIIEPFPIREVASFFSIEVPFQARGVRGTMMAGNSDQTWSSDQVLTVDAYEPDKQQIEYLDLVDMIDGRHPMNGFFRNEKSTRRPFEDARFPRNVPLSTTYVSEMDAALSLMTGSTDNYVTFKQRSGNSGWTYDNTIVGTDSLAFGGMTY